MGKPNPDASPCAVSGATRIVSVVLAMLLAVTMLPAAAISPAYADEPVADDVEVAENGLRYRVADGGATLVGFEDGASLEGALVVPETVGDGATVKAVEIADGQVAEGVTSLTLPQAVENVKTEGLAAAFPALASIEIASGTVAEGDVAAGAKGAAAKGAYSSVAGMLFRSAEGQASSDGEAFAEDALELVWAPPAMVVARIPLECKAIAAGAFVDAAALETVMSFGKMESIAAAEKDGEGNVTKPGAFADEQIARLTIVVPGTNYAVTGEGAERVSGSVALSEKTDMLEKRKAWFHHGFDTSQIIMGAPFGEIEGVNAVSEDGKMEDRSLVTPLENGKSHLELTPEEEAEKAARRGEDPEAGLSFSYQASMDLSVRWAGDRSATPAHIDVPAYAKVDGVTYQVTQVEPSAFEGAVFLASVAIPEGVTAIGESAFAGCTNLKEVSLPSTLKTIDYAAFKGTALESVDIPDSVRIIGGEAFADCSNLQSAVVSEMTHVAGAAFEDGVARSQAERSQASGFSGVGAPQEDDAVETYASGRPPLTIKLREKPTNYTVCYTKTAHPTAEPDDTVGVSHQENITRNQTTAFEYDTPIVRSDYPYLRSHGTSQSWLHMDIYLSNVRSHLGVTLDELKANPDGVSYNFRLFPSGSGGSDSVLRVNAIRLYDENGNDRSRGSGLHAAYGYVNNNFEWGDATQAIVATSDATVSFDSAGGSSVDPQGYLNSQDPTYVTLPTPTREGYRFAGWSYGDSLVNPGSKRVSDSDHTLTARWEADLTLVGGGSASWDGTGGGSKTLSYVVGETVELPKDVKLPGFWLKGWVWANGGTGFNGVTEPTFSLPTSSDGAYGNATLKAVWVPQKYIAEYDVSQAGKKGSTSESWVATPDATTLVSSDAVTAIDTLEDAGERLYAWGTSYADQRAKRDNIAGAAWIDTAEITEEAAHMVDLAGKPAGSPGTSSLDLDGFTFKGWTADSTMSAFNPVTVPTDTTYTLDGDKMHRAFASVWNKTYTADEADKNKVTLYAIWQNRSIDSGGVTLRLNEPTNVNNEGTAIATLDGRGVTDQAGRQPTDAGYVAPTEKIYYWQGRGLLSVAEREAIGTNSPTRNKPGTIDPAMGLVAPARYGFEFLGWGKLDAADTKNERPQDATFYLTYNEADNSFALTEEGVALMKGDDTQPGGWRQTIAEANWDAIWKIREIEVALRIPTHATSDVDRTGASTGADRTGVEGATKVDYSGDSEAYAWREGTSSETGGGASSGWLITKRGWKYYDLLEYPAFKQQHDRYTYDGWFDARKNSMTDSTELALEKAPDTRRVVGFDALRATSHTHVVGTWESGKDLGLDIDDQFFLTGNVGDMDGKRGITVTTDPDTGKASLSKELWLWTSPIRINVASPLGVYLCTTNSYGQAVEPYVVGNDRRTQLEAQAEFSVSTSSHDLQLVDVTAEDVTYVKRDESGNVVNEQEGDITSLAGLSDAGICNQILTPKFPSVGEVSAEAPVTYDDETSRMFWVSPVPTATADQTGVLYKKDTVRARDAASDAGVGGVATASKMAAEEELLHPSVETRRYFGFGHNNDNTIHDELASATGNEAKYKLGGFVLRKDYVDAGSGAADRKADGLARTKVETDDAGNVIAASYRFYYGLDLRRAEFNLTGLQKIIDNADNHLSYNAAFDQPLLRVKFTFAAARNPGISYYSARLGDGASAETYDAFAEAAAATLSEATTVTAGAPSEL